MLSRYSSKKLILPIPSPKMTPKRYSHDLSELPKHEHIDPQMQPTAVYEAGTDHPVKLLVPGFHVRNVGQFGVQFPVVKSEVGNDTGDDHDDYSEAHMGTFMDCDIFRPAK